MQEESVRYTDHDRLFKELIVTFFEEFVEVFFPEEYKDIDFTHVKFLSQDVFTDVTKGEKRTIDILAETKLKNEDTIVLIHVEPQSYYQKEFHERMFIYCSRLYELHRKPILPIAVFSYNDARKVPDTFTLTFPSFHVLTFQYLQLHLIQINWKNYLRTNNPVAAALISKMGYKEEERVLVKLEFLRMISRMELDPARMQLLYGFFETYLTLNEEEEEKMSEEIAKLPQNEAKQIFRLPNSYYEKGFKKGIEKGIEEGKKEKAIEFALKLLKKGHSIEDTAEMAGLSVQAVGKIKESM